MTTITINYDGRKVVREIKCNVRIARAIEKLIILTDSDFDKATVPSLIKDFKLSFFDTFITEDKD